VFGCPMLKIDRLTKLILDLAGIASKSPLAVTGTKAVLLRSRDLTLDQGLDYVATWNSSMLVSDDLTEAISAHTQKRNPVFSKL
jgi:delta(3,5)-delta(2,4)-dienoyl-CoA isomerase